MKLGVIKHVRCGENTFDRTLVWLPDDMTDEVFEKTIAEARADYLAFAIRFKNEDAPNDYRPHSQPPFALRPEMIVADLLAEWAAKKIVWQKWEEDRQQARKKFGDYLDGRNGIKRFWEFEPPHTHECDWGHNHGIQLDYDETLYE